MASGDISTLGGRSMFAFIVSTLQSPDVEQILIAARDPLHPGQSLRRDGLHDPTLPVELLPVVPGVLQNSAGKEEVERHHLLALDLGDPADLSLLGSSCVEAQGFGRDDEPLRCGNGESPIEILGPDQDIDVFREAWKAVNRQRDSSADAVLDSVPVQSVDESQKLLPQVHAAGCYATRARRSRRLLATTETELNAMAALARTGDSRIPNAG